MITATNNPVITTTSGLESSQGEVANASVAKHVVLKPASQQSVAPQSSIPQPSVQSSSQQSNQDTIHIARINGMDYRVSSTVQNTKKTYTFLKVSGKREFFYDPNEPGVLKVVNYMNLALEMKIDLTKPYEQLVPVIIRVIAITINN